MRALVTGGAGFIGSHLCAKLLSDGYDVVCMDNLFTGSMKNISGLMNHKDFIFLAHDVTIPYKVHVDRIFNLACPASPIHYQVNPVKTIRTSVLGAINMLDLAMETGARILQASTSEVYGDPREHPQSESYYGNVNMIGVRSCYDESKRCAEALFMDYHRQFGVDIRIVRIFNCYGPRMAHNDGRVITNFIRQALRGEDITIHGNGSQTRSFQYVDDLIRGFITVMDSEINTPVNIGNPQETTIKEVAELIIEMTNSKSKIVYLPLPQDDPIRRKPDITLAKSLGWEPRISLIEGLQRMIKSF